MQPECEGFRRALPRRFAFGIDRGNFPIYRWIWVFVREKDMQDIGTRARVAVFVQGIQRESGRYCDEILLHAATLHNSLIFNQSFSAIVF